ncbi:MULTISPECIES: methyl-accepting chemotaxis protein [unclassified Pseudomonas]|uniref:methyl-accepting chemotaxis protein n=2 Tax=Pseudomonas TaxID=286 RepID=UPI0017873F84|nr:MULTISPECIES: methyl-accepting chemotaxis protein [unclassified Pseudomonas]MBD8709926.1 methyl-accepting chemotaxis protein [Pseudomonas sp. CFBP 13711]MBD8715149.1 methyl-accepting chemotaxis protein [Pseudomonas sp. CFBP 13715]
MQLQNFKISTRALLCFGLITLILLGLGLFAYVQIDEMRTTEQKLETDVVPSIQVIDDIQIALLHTRLESIRSLAVAGSDAQRKVTDSIFQDIAMLEDKTGYYRAHLVTDEEDNKQFQTANGLMEKYIAGVKNIISLNKTDHQSALDYANNEQAQTATQYQAELTKLRDLNSQNAVNAGHRAAEVYSHSIMVLISVVLVASVLTIGLAYALTRSIVRPVASSLTFAEQIATGDLSGVLAVTGRDEVSSLMIALNVMAGNLKTTITEISGAADQLSTASVEMTSITESADRTLQRQNSEIEQAATAVTEMSAAVEEVARNANSTSEAAKSSSTSAEEGNRRVVNTVTAMTSLADLVDNSVVQVKALASQADDITKVLSVIRAIAEQTNLLALNAAIEAARAGEQGRGFAVVADEVRALAHRTQLSTQEIEQMITKVQSGSAAAVESMDKSRQEVYSTLTSAKDAGSSLRLITDAVLEINERNMQIATASEEQAHVARDVDRNLVSIRDLAMQSTEGARQTLEASNELSKLAVRLNDMVGKFRL